jgi:hypothetical protein
MGFVEVISQNMEWIKGYSLKNNLFLYTLISQRRVGI